jgi:HAD superfamily hydrolase (TIGR01450 family)
MCDLDGVLWLGPRPIPGAADAIARLRAAGVRVTFFTNNSFATRIELHKKFSEFGIEVDDADLFSSAQAAVQLIDPSERALVLGGAGIVEALGHRNIDIVDGSDHKATDVVVVGLDYALTFERLTLAVRACFAGARLIGTNDDATYPTPDGPLPGGGSMLAAVAYASGVMPMVAGKPNEPAVALVRQRLGHVDLMVGDRPETDGSFAVALGSPFALVRSGVTPPGTAPKPPAAQYDAEDLAALVDRLL